MELLFNKEKDGDREIKEILGFLDGGFKFDNLKSDVILATPYLIDFIGKGVYDKVEAYYKNPNSVTTAEEKVKHADALQYMQIYVLSMAYLDFAADNDLNHGNAGRSFRNEENEKLPWEWQIANSNSSIKKRAYKALDQLILTLDASGWSEWTGSDQYKKAKSVFIKNTKDFDDIFPINKSGQLYYRLVPFMDDFETDRVEPILTKDLASTLRGKSTPTAEEKVIIQYVKKAVAYLSLGKAFKAFPIEMFPDGLSYRENTRMKSGARAEVMEFLNNEGEKYLLKLEYEHARQQTTFEEIDPLQGLQEGTKHVSL